MKLKTINIMIHPLHEKAIRYLRRDQVIKKLIDSSPTLTWEKKSNLFQALTYEIVGQQLSNKVTKVIYKRFLDLFGGKLPTARQLLSIPDEKVRSCGCSWAKVRYLKSLAQSVDSGKLDLRNLYKLPDDEVYTQLTRVKGIGPWTAEMFLIFTLHRPDVFSLGDLGLRTAVSKLYDVRRTNLNKISKISAAWKPYRSFACRYLWSSLDNA